MCGVDKVCWLPNHGAINPPPPFRLGLLRDAAAKTNPELSHSEVKKEATAVSSQLRRLLHSLSSCSALSGPQTQTETDDRHTLGF